MKKMSMEIKQALIVAVLFIIAVILFIVIQCNAEEKETVSAKETLRPTEISVTTAETFTAIPTEAPTAEPTAEPTESPKKDEFKPLDIPLNVELQKYIYGLCEAYSVPYELAIAVIECESSFRADACRAETDFGLMQINKFNHEWFGELFGVTNFFNPYQNTLCGVYYLGQQIEDADGNITLALMKYNMGPDEAEAAWNEGTTETKYTQKVLAAFEKYSGKGEA